MMNLLEHNFFFFQGLTYLRLCTLTVRDITQDTTKSDGKQLCIPHQDCRYFKYPQGTVLPVYLIIPDLSGIPRPVNLVKYLIGLIRRFGGRVFPVVHTHQLIGRIAQNPA